MGAKDDAAIVIKFSFCDDFKIIDYFYYWIDKSYYITYRLLLMIIFNWEYSKQILSTKFLSF